MSESASQRGPRERRIDALILEYEQAADEGHRLNAGEFLQKHVEFDSELRDYLAGRGELEQMIAVEQRGPAATIAATGLRIRDYEVLGKIGAGGMGTVYLAMHTRLDKTVALKIIKADREQNSQAIARFEREMKAVGKLEHPHIVRALDAGDEAGTHFLVMEFLEGCDLGRLVKSQGRLEVPLACELIRQAALGLQHAHDHHLVHRDVKPSNLLLSSSGQVKVLDLGLAHFQVNAGEASDRTQVGLGSHGETRELTREGQFVGTWRYMAPEQFLTSRQVDARADIFSLGVSLYSLLVGELPLGPGQTAAYLPPITTLRPDVPPDVQSLLGRMLALNQEERIQTMSVVARELEPYARQGSAHILALGASLKSLQPEQSSAQDATQSWSGTADGVEVIPPPVSPRLPPPRIPAHRNVNWWTRFNLRNMSWKVRTALVASVLLAVTLLAVVATGRINKAIETAKRWEQAAAHIGELSTEFAWAIDRKDLDSAEANFKELLALSKDFAGLIDFEVLNEFQENLRLHRGQQQLANDRYRAVQDAHTAQQWEILAERLKAYLEEPYKTETDVAQSLLADVELYLSLQPTNQTRVANWSDAGLEEFLRTKRLPHAIAIADKSLQNCYLEDLLKHAKQEQRGRLDARLAEQTKPDKAAPLADPVAPPQLPDEEAKNAASRARRALEEERRKAEEEAARQAWFDQLESRGVLTLIPRDALGAVGVANIAQVMKSAREIDGQLRERMAFLSAIGWFLGFGTATITTAEDLLKEVLETAPLGCYQKDRPVALVFANPEKAGVPLAIENLNPLSAMWDRPKIEKLGVVVGTPIDLRIVERNLQLPAGSLIEKEMLHSKLPHFNKVKRISILLRNRRLYVGFTDRSVLAVANRLDARETLATELDEVAGEAARLARMDILLHFGPGAWKQEWQLIANQMRERLATEQDDAEAVKLADDFASLMRLAKTFLMGITLDKGVHASLLVHLPPQENEPLKRFEDLIGQGHRSLTLEGLSPNGAIGAFATRGNGLSNAVIAQSLLQLAQQPGLFPDAPFPSDARNRITLAKAFRDVWNQVEGTRAGSYAGGQSTVVILDTKNPETFLTRLAELVRIWDEISLQLAEGEEDQARYRFAMVEAELGGRSAWRLSLIYRATGEVNNHELWIVPAGKQMVLAYGPDAHLPLQQVITNVTPIVPRPGLAEELAILESGKRLPAARKMELFLWLSQIRKLAEGKAADGFGPPQYSSASLTVGESSLMLDVWIPLMELVNHRDLIKLDEKMLPPPKR